jgi:hypothetical protein
VVGFEPISVGVKVDQRLEVLGLIGLLGFPRVVRWPGHVVFLHRRRIVVEAR